jgi:hypothetical protein
MRGLLVYACPLAALLTGEDPPLDCLSRTSFNSAPLLQLLMWVASAAAFQVESLYMRVLEVALPAG